MPFNKYQVIKGAISYDLANFVFNYFLLKRDRDWETLCQR